MRHQQNFDVVIVGSGFGGSVAALRLAEKGYKVAVLEAGKRFNDEDFPKTSWNLKKFLFFPKLGFKGIQRIHVLPDVLILAGAGVGGGSLVYANTLYQPPKSYFDDKQWSHITDWEEELLPNFKLAKKMLGVRENPYFSPADEAMKKVAKTMGVENTFQMTPLGVLFSNSPGQEIPDPYFGGIGPKRNSCTFCGACMTGCRLNAKNTLVKNYLYLAEKLGVEIISEFTVENLEQINNSAWKILGKRSGAWFGRSKTLYAENVVLAAGAYGTQKLLHKMKSKNFLPNLSDALGRLSRTNSEALTGAIMPLKNDKDFSKGAAITSSFFPDKNTHVEPVRYGKGSNFMGLLQTVMSDGVNAKARRKNWLLNIFKNPTAIFKILYLRKWSERSIITLVMQNVDSSITLSSKRSIFGWRLTSKNDSKTPNATYIPAANEVSRKVAELYGGTPAGHLGDLISAPFTAHFVGGCVISDQPTNGVIDPYHRVWNYPTLHVVDGSSLTANLGVNPSLTITAQAERAFSFWPNKNDADPRPRQGEAYKKLTPVDANQPVLRNF
ncbi:MAG: GMC family oxidoreductase N-terminal domain-containing protein [Candidatus Nanopelagicales bacterium]